MHDSDMARHSIRKLGHVNGDIWILTEEEAKNLQTMLKDAVEREGISMEELKNLAETEDE